MNWYIIELTEDFFLYPTVELKMLFMGLIFLSSIIRIHQAPDSNHLKSNGSSIKSINCYLIALLDYVGFKFL